MLDGDDGGVWPRASRRRMANGACWTDLRLKPFSDRKARLAKLLAGRTDGIVRQ